MIPERLESDRLILRRFNRRDADSIAESVMSSLPELGRWLPWAHVSYNREDAASFIRESSQAWREGRAFDFAIRSKKIPDRHIGNVSIWPVSRLGRTGEIGYWVRSDSTSSGIGTEATAKVMELGFSQLGFHKINLRIAVGNHASEKIATKLGFTKEGILREELQIRGRWVDHHLYSMLETEFRSNRKMAATPGEMRSRDVSESL